ncbi:hypothetical protein BGZ65_005261 [Modicella reniformis]|uniref:Uncharacterized protein n=1 Tax=Modicella reniformis TaxID=1440133 RepID=A0A9P6STG2_9FUNG|nr:hypothetical protein BGZ65_005261 [Modicella reniformis]
MDYADHEGEGQQFSRDNFVSYHDVYNIWRTIITKAMRKDEDPVLSAIKWMERIRVDGGFTYYDENDRIYLYEKDKAKARELITRFRAKCQNQEPFLLFLNNNYFGDEDIDEATLEMAQKNWMVCYRQEVSCSGIDTNNYIES